MSEENNQPPDDAPNEADDSPKEQLFTQADLDAAAAKARAQGKRQAKKELEQRMAQDQTKETTTGTEKSDFDAAVKKAVEEAMMAIAKPLHEQLNELSSQAEQAKFAAAIGGLELSEHRKEELQALYGVNKDLFEKAVASERAKDEPPQPRGPGFTGIGAPNPIPDAERLSQPHKWTRDDIETMKANGTFLSNVQKYSAGLPGSGGGLFPAKTPGKK